MKWEKKRIRDFATVYDGPHATPKESETGPIFLGIKNIRPEGGLNLSEIRHISESEYEKWTKRVTPRGSDIVLSYEATLHRYAIIPNAFVGCLGRRMALVRVNQGEVSEKFLYYIFLSDGWRGFIDANKLTGATVDRISITDFPDYKVPIPPLPTQRKIASILSAYDDLIENNLKRIKLLEEKAFLRYKQIVREKKLTEKSILDICYITDGTHDSPKLQTEGFYLVTGKHLIGGFIDFSSAYFISETDHYKIQKRSKVDDGDLILSNIGTIGNVAIIEKQFDFSVKNVIIFKPNRIEFSPFLYCYLNSSEMQTRFQQESSGTSQRFISLKYCRDLKVRVPKEDVLKEFHQEVSDLLKLKSLLNQQNSKLREARDILLPKLMNGEIEV